MGDRLLEFTGTECTHCKELKPHLKKLEKEEGIKVITLEVWHDKENFEFMKSVDKDKDGNVFCGGVPFLFNEKTGERICGVVDYDKLKGWALGTKTS